MKKTKIDHFFDYMLISAPFVLLTKFSPDVKSLLMFYVFYLPYLLYAGYKHFTKKEVENSPELVTNKIKIEEVEYEYV